MTFPIDDHVGAWVPHGRFVIEGAAQGPLRGLRFAVKDLFDVAGHPTGAGNPTWLATHPVPTAAQPVGGAAAGRRRHADGQGGHRRAGLQHPRRQRALRRAAQQRGAAARDRRLVERLGRRGGRGPGGFRARHRHRRLDARAGELLRPVGPAHHARRAAGGRFGAAEPVLRHRNVVGARCSGVRRGRRACCCHPTPRGCATACRACACSTTPASSPMASSATRWRG